MKDGAIVANSGHFNVEIDIPALESLASGKRQIREFVDEYDLRERRRKIHLLGEGRLINLAAAEGHPAMVMDMSFANQAARPLRSLGQAKGARSEEGLSRCPEPIDQEIARLKLASMGIGIDKLTPEQKKYLDDWEEGT